MLLIEDDDATRDLMRQLLSDAGFRVVTSDEGRKAIEIAGVTRPSVVILDLVTQGMDGWAFLERRMGEPALSHVPVVVVTGSNVAPPSGAAAVFRKPVDPGALVRAVRSLARG